MQETKTMKSGANASSADENSPTEVAPHKSVSTSGKPNKSGKKKLPKSLIIGLVFVGIGILFATLPFLFMVVNTYQSHEQADSHAQAVQALKPPSGDIALQEARQYNQDLYRDGAKAIGEVQDPWSGSSDSASEKDTRYQKMLDIPADGIMATIQYPRLGINLPIRHGTGNEVLSAGAGHLYGTSLPVGGVNTHAVISAHTGYDRLMFDRLSLREGKIGDFFYIQVLGETLAYQVRSIEVIEPDDFSHFGIEAGKDQVTLLTCTPYGVNNKRLLVTGERVSMPEPAPDPASMPQSHPERMLIASVLVVWLLFTLFVLLYLRKRRRRRKSAVGRALHRAE